MIAQPSFPVPTGLLGVRHPRLRGVAGCPVPPVRPGCCVLDCCALRAGVAVPMAGVLTFPWPPGQIREPGPRSFQLMSPHTITGQETAGRARPQACHGGHGYDSPLTWPDSVTA